MGPNDLDGLWPRKMDYPRLVPFATVPDRTLLGFRYRSNLMSPLVEVA